MSNIYKTILTIIIIISVFLSVWSFYTIKTTREVKEDLVHLSSIQYGLFNVDEWKKMFQDLVIKKLEEFEVTNENEEQIKEDLSSFLYKSVDRVEAQFQDEKKEQLFGWVSSSGASFFKIFDRIRSDIPVIVDEVVAYLRDDAKRAKLAGFVNAKMNRYADSTFSEMDYSARDLIIQKYDFSNSETSIIGLNILHDKYKHSQKMPVYTLITLWLFVFGSVMLKKSLGTFEVTTLSIGLFSLLVLGLITPMIDIDARISSFSFQLIGESIEFKDQVIFFKSKSILEVVKLMLLQPKFDGKLIGFLVLLFSVLSPITKLIALNIYMHIKNAESKLIKFLAFKIGKWSMADVFVIAIFMAFIGFNGILRDQLRGLEGISNNIDLITTNNSVLQPGFYFFTIFTFMGIVVSHKAKKGPVTVSVVL